MLEVRAFQPNFSFAIHLVAMEKKPNSRKISVGKLVMEEVEVGTYLEPYSMSLESNEIAQQLMDDLWKCGLRPTEGTGSAGSLAATQRHLEDMRKLVFEGRERR